MANTATRVATNEVRFSYIHVFRPYANQQGADPKYSTTILVPKSDTVTKAAIDAAVEAAKIQGANKCWGGVTPPLVACCVHDGDGPRPSDGMPFGEECKGHWVFTASTKQQPFVVDANVQPILQETEVYSGMYGRVSVNFFPYNSNGKKGIGCGLDGIQKLRDGEPLGGGISAAEAFGAPIQQPPAPVYTQPAAPMYAPAAHPGYYGAPNPAPAVDPITGLPVNR